MRNRYKVILRIIFALIILVIVALISLQFKNPNNKPNYKEIDVIKDYNYTLENRDSKLMQDTFKSLKEILNKEVDYKEYAKYLSELFIIDLFTIDNKDNKYDVGSTEYVLSDVVENYKLNVSDTLYKYVEDKNTNKRSATLPIVKSIEEKSIEEEKYVYNNEEYDAYKVVLNWTYEIDLDYPTKGEVILIKKDNKLYVTSFKEVVVEE